jgi:hypothetical protein
MRCIAVWVALAALASGSSCRSKTTPAGVGARQSNADAKRPIPFELTVETTSGGTSVLVFRFPDQVGRIPQISGISIGKVKAGEGCAIHVRNMAGELIAGFWPLGMVPKNYKLDDGCKETSLSPGDYEIQVVTQRGEFRNRLHVAGDGSVRVLPWEERGISESWRL